MFRKFLKSVVNIMSLYTDFGIYIFVSMIIPMNWTQDVNFVNDGYDILSFKNTERSYFTGTYWQWKKEWV